MESPFELPMLVRDYECDLEGIVNNAVYLNYLEHTRHEFLKSRGLNFAEFTRQGIFLVVVRIEVDYLSPLRSGDQFVVTLIPDRISRLRFGFTQEIFRIPERQPVLHARVIGAATDRSGSPRMPRGVLDRLMSKILG